MTLFRSDDVKRKGLQHDGTKEERAYKQPAPGCLFPCQRPTNSPELIEVSRHSSLSSVVLIPSKMSANTHSNIDASAQRSHETIDAAAQSAHNLASSHPIDRTAEAGHNASVRTQQTAQDATNRAANAADRTADRAAGLANDASAKSQQAADKTRDAANTAADKTRDAANMAQAKTQEALAQAQENARRLSSATSQRVHQLADTAAHHPLVQQTSEASQRQLNALDRELSKYGFLNEFENRTGVSKTYGVLGVGGAATVIILSNLFGLAQPLTNAVGWLLPTYLSCRALESPQTGDDKQWLTYWIICKFDSNAFLHQQS